MYMFVHGRETYIVYDISILERGLFYNMLLQETRDSKFLSNTKAKNVNTVHSPEANRTKQIRIFTLLSPEAIGSVTFVWNTVG